jgi:hypothetical protein
LQAPAVSSAPTVAATQAAATPARPDVDGPGLVGAAPVPAGARGDAGPERRIAPGGPAMPVAEPVTAGAVGGGTPAQLPAPAPAVPAIQASGSSANGPRGAGPSATEARDVAVAPPTTGVGPVPADEVPGAEPGLEVPDSPQ